MKKQYPPDFILMSIVLILLGLGLVTIYSSSAIYALDRFGSSTYFLLRQTIWISIGLFFALFFIIYDHRNLKKWIFPILISCFILLVLVLVAGHTVGGAKRWLRFGGIGFQPSELTKIVMILFVAYYCDKKRSKIHDFKRGILPLLSVIGIFCLLIFLEPDLGTPVLIAVTCVMMIFIGGGQIKQILTLGLSLVPLVIMAIWMVPYRRKRFFSFLNPWENAQGGSYQLVQSLLAMGSGGLTGVGLGNAQSKLLYLPEPHTDFIFPILSEEFGFTGSLGILLFFAVFAWVGFRIAERSADLFSRLLASGITLLILLQAVFNIAMVTGCIPTKGLPLPFISFGGSSLVVTLASVGILLNISRHAERR